MKSASELAEIAIRRDSWKYLKLWVWAHDYGYKADEWNNIMPPAADEYGNVTSTAIITVPRGCCFSLSVEYVDATVDDPATTPTPTIEVQNANLVITRIA